MKRMPKAVGALREVIKKQKTRNRTLQQQIDLARQLTRKIRRGRLKKSLEGHMLRWKEQRKEGIRRLKKLQEERAEKRKSATVKKRGRKKR
jgi:hypothetical protein